MADDPTKPPGPVGTGPGFWTYDAWGGGWRNDWVPNGQGGYMIKGSGEGSGGPAGPGAMPSAEHVHASQQKSPHFNAALAAAYARLHPNAGTEFLSAGESGLNPGFNPDIARLAGIPVTQGWKYPTQAAGGALPPGPVADQPVGTYGQGGPPPPQAAPATPPTGPVDIANLLQHAGGAAPQMSFPQGVDPTYIRLAALQRLAQQMTHPLGGGPVTP